MRFFIGTKADSVDRAAPGSNGVDQITPSGGQAGGRLRVKWPQWRFYGQRMAGRDRRLRCLPEGLTPGAGRSPSSSGRWTGMVTTAVMRYQACTPPTPPDRGIRDRDGRQPGRVNVAAGRAESLSRLLVISERRNA